VTIERLAPGRAGEYRELMLEAYASHPDAFTSTVEERSSVPLGWWESRLSAAPQANEVVFGFFQGARLVGAAGVSFGQRQKTRHKALVFGMYVSDRARRQGAGRDLLARVLSECRRRDVVRIVQLTVTRGNRAAEALYSGAGFIAFGEEPRAVCVGESFVTKIHMWLEL
jgi:GNAT superfamily N-acetyltransferase